ncbi:uncharacterized protein N7487_011504 [Penicillium crustosum]|uniref:uncharacterized protein n=1 Tax=Penicillium crustosum TaxID=36656 RepID=UPI002399D8A6|nr:uncharacterized protein N7487_011504 [Penicillium crustosum]KAJ5393863.1 hypothetical protein N7487_011504 [Penicillium crustosum]
MLSHDFIKRLARELIFDLGGHRVYGITFSNWVCTHHVLRDPLPALSRGVYSEMEVQRLKKKKKRRCGRVRGGLLYVHVPGTFPKWMALHSCLFYLSGLLVVAGDHAELYFTCFLQIQSSSEGVYQ